MADSFIQRYIKEAKAILDQISPESIEKVKDLIAAVQKNEGRIFFIGVGGGAGHASHAVNDFRKICGIECYTPSDNVSELTARINDDGWDTAYAAWLDGSRLGNRDLVFVFSVGGGNLEKKISINLIKAIEYAKGKGAKVCGVVGRDGGFTAKQADACVVVPVVNPETVTAHTEAFQAVIWHLLVGHPELQKHKMKWESVKT